MRSNKHVVAATTQTTKTLHFIWWQGWASAPHSVPADALQWVMEWQLLHPTFEVQRWDEASFFQVAVPHLEATFPQVRDVFARLRVPVEKVDLARWLILYAFGGIYIDCDMRCIRGVSQLHDECLRDDAIFLAKEPGGRLNNAIICCARPCDAAVHAVCIGLFQRILMFSSACDWPGTVVVTGPVAITSIISSNQLIVGRFRIENGGPLVFGAGSKGSSVRSAETPSDIAAGALCFALLCIPLTPCESSVGGSACSCRPLIQELVGWIRGKLCTERVCGFRNRTLCARKWPIWCGAVWNSYRK
jgi:hypothetical protein